VLLILSLTFLLAGEAVFGEILNRLKDGMVYGNGGYLIFIWAPLLLLSGYSLRVNVLYLVLASATPHMLALFGFIHGFQHNHYAVLIWPTTVTMMMAHFAFTQNYWRRYQSELALKHACDTDPLTQVANRRHFLPRLSHEISRAQRTHREVSLAMIDIDNFKRVNDRYGHPTGDLVICAVANVCRTVSRNMDVVARMGGEEFAVMLPETSLSDAKLLAERIRMAVENTTVISTDGEPCHVTVSIGVAQQAPDEASQENLIRQADAALYKAKNAGRNRVASD
jgi:diguanylate cyclase (GGDEF)-like protein